MPVLRWSLACFVAIYILMTAGLAVFSGGCNIFQIVISPSAQAGMSSTKPASSTPVGDALVTGMYGKRAGIR